MTITLLQVGFSSPFYLMKFIFPLLILMTGMDISWDQVNAAFFANSELCENLQNVNSSLSTKHTAVSEQKPW